MGTPLGPARLTILLITTKINFLSPLRNRFSILVKLMIHLLFSDQNLKHTKFLQPYTQP